MKFAAAPRAALEGGPRAPNAPWAARRVTSPRLPPTRQLRWNVKSNRKCEKRRALEVDIGPNRGLKLQLLLRFLPAAPSKSAASYLKPSERKGDRKFHGPRSNRPRPCHLAGRIQREQNWARGVIHESSLRFLLSEQWLTVFQPGLDRNPAMIK